MSHNLTHVNDGGHIGLIFEIILWKTNITLTPCYKRWEIPLIS